MLMTYIQSFPCLLNVYVKVVITTLSEFISTRWAIIYETLGRACDERISVDFKRTEKKKIASEVSFTYVWFVLEDVLPTNE